MTFWHWTKKISNNNDRENLWNTNKHFMYMSNNCISDQIIKMSNHHDIDWVTCEIQTSIAYEHKINLHANNTFTVFTNYSHYQNACKPKWQHPIPTLICNAKHIKRHDKMYTTLTYQEKPSPQLQACVSSCSRIPFHDICTGKSMSPQAVSR